MHDTFRFFFENCERYGIVHMMMLLLLVFPVAATADVFVREDIITSPRPDLFSICQDYSCKTVVEQAMTPAEWKEASSPLSSPSPDAATERSAIAAAIRKMEEIIGVKTGTSHDLGGTFPGTGLTGQMDCIDESTNTTTYLRMLSSAGFLKKHVVDDRAHRGFFIFGWPHSTAVIRESGSNLKFAVDSWFHPNGEPPEILLLETWRDGWEPLE